MHMNVKHNSIVAAFLEVGMSSVHLDNIMDHVGTYQTAVFFLLARRRFSHLPRVY